MATTLDKLKNKVSACEICRDRFAATATQHEPRPVVWFDERPRILIVGQAPGMRVHKSGRPFLDPSGDRLRNWMGIGDEIFYDRSRISILPMAFCFPGYNLKGSDLPPPPICAKTWCNDVMQMLGAVPLTLIIGGYAQKWHLRVTTGVTDTVANWGEYAPARYPLPHPSWRNSAWLKKNPWFGTDLLPSLRRHVAGVLND